MFKYSRHLTSSRGTRKSVLTPALGLALGLLVPSVGAAQDTCKAGNCPTTFSISNLQVQKSPTSVKFQAQLSKAKIPVGNALFSNIIAKVKNAGSDLCKETLKGVRARDSVLNLEIGKSSGQGTSCQLDELVATNNSLQLEICIESEENCLKPIDFASVPYAMKATYASQATIADRSDIAAQCHYTHRATADADLFQTNVIERGYYDFSTPSEQGAALNTVLSGLTYNAQSVALPNQGGFIQWAPVVAPGVPATQTRGEIHMCARADSANVLTRLSKMVMHADLANVRGNVDIDGTLNVDSDVTIMGVGGSTTSLAVQGDSDMRGNVMITGSNALGSNALGVSGRANIQGDTTITGSGTAGTVGLTVSKGANIADGLTVSTGDSVVATGNLAVTAGTATVGGRVTVQSGGVGVTGASSFNGATTFTPASGQQTSFNGNTSFTPASGSSTSFSGLSSFFGNTSFAPASGASTGFAGNTTFTPASGFQTTFNGKTVFTGNTNIGAAGTTTTFAGTLVGLPATNSAGIADGAVTTPKLFDLAVSEAKLGTGAVTATKLGDLAVKTAKLDNLAVSEAKLAANAVTETKILNGAVTNAKLLGSISASKLKFASVSVLAPLGTSEANRPAGATHCFLTQYAAISPIDNTNPPHNVSQCSDSPGTGKVFAMKAHCVFICILE